MILPSTAMPNMATFQEDSLGDLLGGPFGPSFSIPSNGSDIGSNGHAIGMNELSKQ
jgi:hypothetical protein